MENSIDKESGLGGLFQQIIMDMKVSKHYNMVKIECPDNLFDLYIIMCICHLAEFPFQF